MAFSVNPITHVITIPKTDLTLVSGTLYTHDTNAFRLALKAWEESFEGIVQQKTHEHNTEVVVAGVTYARAISILAPYSIEYEDGQYSVILTGSNNNIFDIASGILVQNQVQVIPTNSAGLVVTGGGGGGSAPTVQQIRIEIDANSTQLAAIKERTDNLPDTPADVTDVPTPTENADAVWNKTLP